MALQISEGYHIGKKNDAEIIDWPYEKEIYLLCHIQNKIDSMWIKSSNVKSKNHDTFFKTGVGNFFLNNTENI